MNRHKQLYWISTAKRAFSTSYLHHLASRGFGFQAPFLSQQNITKKSFWDENGKIDIDSFFESDVKTDSSNSDDIEPSHNTSNDIEIETKDEKDSKTETFIDLLENCKYVSRFAIKKVLLQYMTHITSIRLTGDVKILNSDLQTETILKRFVDTLVVLYLKTMTKFFGETF